LVVYADLIFLMNFLMDAAILYTTARTRKLSFRWWRLAVSASIGASYVVMMFVPALSFLYTFFVKCIFSILMIMTAFGFGSLQNFIRSIGTFYLISFAAAGGLFGLHYFLASSSEVMNGILFTHSGGMVFQMHIAKTALFILIPGAVFLWWFRGVFTSTKQREGMTQFLAQVQVQIADYTASCTGLIDTGNQLYDPLTRTPVMVMEASEWGEVLPEIWLKRIRSAEVDQLISGIGNDDFPWQDRLRLVPYRGVNRATTFMLAIKPDKVVITHNDKRMESTKVLIGLDGGKLCTDGSYKAIIHPTLITAG
jgi:stage II sporulation protein GA (sporulation sigma-E factor processing peptidase)